MFTGNLNWLGSVLKPFSPRDIMTWAMRLKNYNDLACPPMTTCVQTLSSMPVRAFHADIGRNLTLATAKKILKMTKQHNVFVKKVSHGDKKEELPVKRVLRILLVYDCHWCVLRVYALYIMGVYRSLITYFDVEYVRPNKIVLGV